MAVMTSLDGVELEHKTQPVPSSDKMALDLDINGISKDDEQTRDASLPDLPVTSTSDLPLNPIGSNAEATNGFHNNHVVEANNAYSNSFDLPDAPVGLDGVELNDSASASLPTVNIGTDASISLHTSNPTSLSAQSQILESTSNSHALSQELLKQTSELPPAPTAVPPLVEAQESDTRDSILPATQEQAADIMAEKHELDLMADADLASGLDESASSAHVTLAQSFDDEPLHPVDVSNLDLNQTSQADLNPNLTVAGSSHAMQQDASMLDAPQSPSKTRVREDDAEDGPSAKRTKTEDDLMAVDVTAPQAPITQNGDTAVAPGDELAPTPYQQKELLKAMKNIKGTQAGKNFARSVADLWPAIKDAYHEKVPRPMDLSLIEQCLRDGYESLGAFKRDVGLIYHNTLLFNGPDHVVTQAGATVRDYLLGKIPSPEPVKLEKKRKATPVADPGPRAPPARRQSRGAAITATSPINTTPAQTFALDPSGTPLIRRDSTRGEGGRPKREIHPPKSKDLIYNARPKKKKFATELKFCEEVLNEIKKPRYNQYSAPFMVPVDPVALGIPDYFKIIKTPMDLSKVTTRLTSGQYESAKDFEADVKQIFKNCYKFNPAGSPVHEIGKSFEQIFDQEWAKKAQYIADHASNSNAASPTSTVDSEEEESEEEEPEEVISSTSAIQERLIEEQTKLIAIMGAKKPDPVLIRMQQEMIAIIQKQIEAENSKKAKTKAKPKPKKAAGASKKKAESTKKAYKPKHIGTIEKEQISAGIQLLEGKLLDTAVTYLKMDYPNLNLDDETELDIDQFTTPVLSRLHDLIIKNVPGIVPVKAEPVRTPKPTRPKKNKPMSKTEQETKIEKLRKLKEQFDRQGSTSDDAPAGRVVPSVEQDQSSGDDSPSDSEED